MTPYWNWHNAQHQPTLTHPRREVSFAELRNRNMDKDWMAVVALCPSIAPYINL